MNHGVYACTCIISTVLYSIPYLLLGSHVLDLALDAVLLLPLLSGHATGPPQARALVFFVIVSLKFGCFLFIWLGGGEVRCVRVGHRLG